MKLKGLGTKLLRTIKKAADVVSVLADPDPGNDMSKISPSAPEEVDGGSLEVAMLGKWVEGTSLRDVLAGGAASAAIWASTQEECKNLEGAVLSRGPYLVNVRIEVEFEEVDEEYMEGREAVFNGAALVHKLQVDDGQEPTVH
jgi:hypothetical protein